MTLFSGRTAFKMKDEKGMPLDLIVEMVRDRGMAINWVEFIETARKSKWWDFQTIEQMEHALIDAGCDDEYRTAVIQRAKLYILNHPHPGMK
jgi:alanyl-tRNA synthetase